MSGNFWCFGCKTWINKNETFIVVKCSDENECGNCDYFCDELCIETLSFNRNIDFTKCNCCEGDIIKEFLKN